MPDTQTSKSSSRHKWAESRNAVDVFFADKTRNQPGHVSEIVRYLVLTEWPIEPSDMWMGAHMILAFLENRYPASVKQFMMNRNDADDIVAIHNAKFEPKIDWW